MNTDNKYWTRTCIAFVQLKPRRPFRKTWQVSDCEMSFRTFGKNENSSGAHEQPNRLPFEVLRPSHLKRQREKSLPRRLSRIAVSNVSAPKTTRTNVVKTCCAETIARLTGTDGTATPSRSAGRTARFSSRRRFWTRKNASGRSCRTVKIPRRRTDRHFEVLCQKCLWNVVRVIGVNGTEISKRF